jgi:hypothetical protein
MLDQIQIFAPQQIGTIMTLKVLNSDAYFKCFILNQIIFYLLWFVKEQGNSSLVSVI